MNRRAKAYKQQAAIKGLEAEINEYKQEIKNTKWHERKYRKDLRLGIKACEIEIVKLKIL